jgi:dTDP-4-dehydrorhamnose 3,5-epimerase
MDAGRPFSPTELIVIFTETKLKGAFVIDLDRKQDLRGFFARAFCQHEFKAYRFQFPLAAETKLVRCTRGGIVDLRPESSTYLQHVSVELNEDNHRRFVPERFAHGYQTLHDNTDTSYSVGEFYTPADEDGILSAPRTAVAATCHSVSEKDQKFAPLDQSESEIKRRMSVI